MHGLTSPTAEPSSIDALLSLPPYGVGEDERQRKLLDAMNEAFGHHVRNCPSFRRFCANRGYGADHRFGHLADFPYLPAQAFKENADLLRSVDEAEVRTEIRSSATSGLPSVVPVDGVTAKRQVRALAAVIGEALGRKRRPLLMLDVSPEKGPTGGLGARGAAVRGFLNLASDVQYFMDVDDKGELLLKEEEFARALADLQGPALVFGFTFVLYAHAIEPFMRANRRFEMPAGSHVAHIGGWKKLIDRKVSSDVFNRNVFETLGVAEERIVDFYGFTEQMGVTYPSGPSGDKHCPAFAEVIVRDPRTFEPVPDGREGLLQFVTPLPHSYPGLSVLTDDVGVVTGRSASDGNWGGTRFKVIGRAPKAEVRGCGDIMGEKMAAGPLARMAPDPSRPGPNARVLWAADANHVAGWLDLPIDLHELPQAGDLAAVAGRLKEGRALLDQYSSDELIALIAAAARRWTEADGPLAPLKQQGLSFLVNWCSGDNLRRLADESLRGRRGHLDGFMPSADHGREFLRAVHRGLACHWLAGNVPLLGMLVLVQSILCRNANLLKVASSHGRALPALLDAFRGLEVAMPGGRLLRGDDILESIAVVYFSRDDAAAGEQMSQAADVRIAWGGAEAVAGILDLPRRYSCEDIVFGPKLSFMVIGREQLDTPRAVRKLAKAAATDASVFDQYACASPHNIFVEAGGAMASPHAFAEALAEDMAKSELRIPKGPADLATMSAIRSARMRHELQGSLWSSPDTNWTVLLGDMGGAPVLKPPVYSRTVSVQPVHDAMDCATLASPDIQTISLALAGPRRLAFAEQAARLGAMRFPDIGRMTHFQSPWDGLFPMERLVRWVSLGGPI